MSRLVTRSFPRPGLGAGLLLFLIAAVLVPSDRAAAGEHRGKEKVEKRYAYGYQIDGEGEGFSYGLFRPDGHNTMSGSMGRAWKAVSRLVEREDRPMMWVSIEGKDWVIRNSGVLSRANAVVQPMSELGERQGALGIEQSRIGEKQSAIGEKQSRIGVRQGALSIQLVRLSGDDENDREREGIEAELATLERRMDALAREMEPLSRQQEALGRRQSALGNEMQRLSAHVSVELRRLAEDAIDHGMAEPLRFD